MTVVSITLTLNRPAKPLAKNKNILEDLFISEFSQFKNIAPLET